jgi:hypothetical protein
MQSKKLKINLKEKREECLIYLCVNMPTVNLKFWMSFAETKHKISPAIIFMLRMILSRVSVNKDVVRIGNWIY